MVLSGYLCQPEKWLGQYPSDPLDCVQYVRADADCVGDYYNHAAASDNNCACITSDVDCSSTTASGVMAYAETNVHWLLPMPPSPPPSPPPP